MTTRLQVAYIGYLGKQPISWSSRKQKGVARSSIEAEYRSVAVTAAELCWILSVAQEICIHLTSTPTIFCDNIGATHLSANPVFHSRVKHIALDYHFVRELVQACILRVLHISLNDQLADALTKPLPRTRFRELAVRDVHLEGGMLVYSISIHVYSHLDRIGSRYARYVYIFC